MKKEIADHLRGHVNECAESVKVDYLEKWRDDFGAMECGDERDAERLLGGYLLTISDGYHWVSYIVAYGMPNSDPQMGHCIW